LKFLAIAHEFTKAAHVIEVERSITGDYFLQVLDRLVVVREHPGFIGMDNGVIITGNSSAS